MEASRPAGMSRKRFCAYMSLNRSTLYYKPKGESAEKYVYLNPTKDVMELRSGIAKLMRYYNYERPHQSLELLLPTRQYGIIAAA